MAFVLDTTGSMGGLLEGAKRKIWSIATAIVDSNPDADIRMGLVAYRDIGDDYVTKKVELTTDIQDLYANLLELKARGGGDWPESVNEALDVAVNKLQWTTGGDTRRIVFLVGDAPPHMDYAQDTKYPVTLSVAKQKDIIVNAVLAGDARDTERVWRDIAQNGNGRFIPIPQDGGQVVIIETPFDEEIIILQREINGTVIPYGPRATAEAHRGQDQAIVRGRRRRARAGLGDGELSQQALEGDLGSRHRRWRPRRRRHGRPQQLFHHQGRRPARQSARDEARAARDEVNKQMGQRKALNEKLSALVAKRDKYVADQRAKAPPKASSFDRVVEDTLKAQIKR